MKRKSLFTICAIALMLVLSLSVLAACNKNKHNFSGEWKNDEQYHWHECVTKKHTDVADKADHTFDAGVVTKDPTEAEEGVKTFTCTVCGYQKTEAVPKLGHTFDMNKWKYDDENHWHPATCGHTDEKKDLGAHVWNEGVVTKEPTEAEEGVKTYTCTTCGKTKTATIGRLDHEHTFNMEAWTFDDENHWHPATCGHTDEKKDLGAHVWNEGVVTKEPTEAEEGVKTYTCTTCGKTKTATIGKLDHVHTFDMEAWKFDDENHWHPATCGHADEKKDLAAHVWNEGVVTKEPTEAEEGVKTYTCTTCGKTKTATIGKLDHVHTFDMEAWKFDDENHWHPATCGHADEKKDLAAHVWNEGVVTKEPTEAEEGVKTYTCTTCGKTKTATIGRLDHEHTFNMEAWTFDDENHWHPATCGHTDEKKGFEAHNWNAGVVTTEPNYGVEGEKTFTCTVCKTTRTEPIAALAAKDNEIVLKAGKTLGKEYDREAISITKEDFVIEGNREPAFMFKVKGAADDTYTADAPKNAGEYTVKVSVAATAEWKAASNTFDFAIAKKSLTATATKTYDGNATMPATLTGVVAGDAVTATITMTSKNVGATVKEVTLEGADKDNYTIKTDGVTANITAKPLTATANKVYDGNATMPATITDVVAGETVTATITMTSKNVGATVKEVMLAGADKDNYTLTAANVNASITPMTIGVDWWLEYDSTSVFTGEPAELLAGDEATITVTMESANVGAAVQDFEITGKDAANYSLAIEDVNVEIAKADIEGFEVSNVSAFTEFFIGATNIPEPTTDYVEIGTGYGEKTIVWEMQVNADDNIWGPIFAGIDKVRKEKGYYRVRIQYAEGDNYNFGRTEYVYFTVKAKPRTLTVKSFAGKTYDGKPFANFTFKNLVNKFGATAPSGVENFTSCLESGEKYVEYRKKGEVLWTKVTDTYIPKNAAEYEYRIGVTATDEWEAVVSEVKTFTIKPYEFVLELGYGQNQHNESYDSGKTFRLRTFNKTNGNELIEGQEIQLWLDNEKAGFETREKNNIAFVFVPDQKKQLTTDCFFLKIGNITNPVMENYKIVTKSSSVTTVEITVVERLTGEKSTSGSIIMVQPSENWIRTTVVKGYFQVGQTVEIYNKNGVKVGEATITEIRAGGTTSASGFAIPSDGTVIIVLDNVAFGNLAELVGGNSKIVAK